MTGSKSHNPATDHSQQLEYGVNDDAVWGPRWVDAIVVEDTSTESVGNVKRRRYIGDEFGDLVVAWFNEMASTRCNRVAYQRVCRLFRTLLKLLDVGGDQEALQKIVTSIDKQLQYYSQRPRYFAMKTHDVGFHNAASPRVQSFFDVLPSATNVRELSTVSSILELANRGLLHKVRRCGWGRCRRWLYARFPHQRFCDEQCKNKYCASKRFKAEHSAKQRVTDELHRSGKVKI
jgi:hypothetical protein